MPGVSEDFGKTIAHYFPVKLLLEHIIIIIIIKIIIVYRGADKFLARPGRKQANVSVRMV